MKKIPLQIKEEYLCYCSNHMMNVVSDGMTYLIFDIRTKLLAGSFDPENLIDINIDPDVLLELHQQLGGRAEYLTSGIHQRLKEILLSQLQNLLETLDTSDPEQLETLMSVAHVAQILGEREAASDAWLDNEINQGRQRLVHN